MSSSKTIAIVGATGNQGLSVAKTFLGLPDWHVRALVRNPSSEKAQELATLGAEAVQADLDDLESLTRAFDGAHAIFVLTTMWPTYASARMAGKDLDESSQIGYDVEVRYAKNAAIAASRTATLQRFVFSALGPMKAASGGKYTHATHWETKAAAVDYIERELPELASKASFIYPGAYITNPFLLPKPQPATGEYVMVMPARESLRFPIINERESTGLFVRALVEDEEPRTKLLAYDSMPTIGEALGLWSKYAGKPAKYVQVTLQGAQELSGLPLELLEAPVFMDEYGYTAGVEGVIEPHQLRNKVVTPSYEDWLKTQDVEYLLGGQYPKV